MWLCIAEKVYKVRGQRSRSTPPDQLGLTYNGGGIHFDGVWRGGSLVSSTTEMSKRVKSNSLIWRFLSFVSSKLNT